MSHTGIPVEKKEKYRRRIRKRETKKNDGNILPNEKLNLSKGRQNGKSNDTLCGQSIRNLTEYYYTHHTQAYLS